MSVIKDGGLTTHGLYAIINIYFFYIHIFLFFMNVDTIFLSKIDPINNIRGGFR
jgi:hypothetical protein